MTIENFISYLNEQDLSEFGQYFGTEDEEFLVVGSSTRNRLERYLPESENFTLRVIFTAVVRDFKLPSVRYSFVVAITLFVLFMDDRNVTDKVKDIVTTELALVKKHLMDDERVKYQRDLELVTHRWNEYLSDPSNFVL